MKLISRTILAAALALALSSCCSREKTVYLADFLTEESAADATPAVRSAVEYCIENGATKLILPGGQLRLRPEYAVERYIFTSNNNESLKRIAFDISGVENFTIEGNGTELLFTGFISPFNFENCKNITVRDLTIDYTRTFHSEGTVAATGEGWLEMDFPDEYICDIVNGCLQFRDNQGIVYPFSSLLEFDAVKREPAFHVCDYWLSNRTIPAEKCANGNIRIKRDGLKATVGNIIVFGASARYNPAFTLWECDGVTIHDVNLYHCGGMGVIAQCSRDIELLRLNVTPTPGSGRMISITADATHFVNCGGYIRMIDCLFENQKDDATNIHGLYMAVDKILGKDKVLLGWHNSGQYGVDFIKEGMRMEFVDNNNVETYAHRTVKSVRRLNKVSTEVTFTEPLPENIALRHVLAADEEYPEVLIKGCTMRGNRARGLLIGSRAPMVIEDNYFHIAGAAILLEGDANFWYEQAGVRDVLIRNNVFENGNYGFKNWGTACIAAGSRIPDMKTSRYHKNIRVEGNTFRIYDPRIVNVFCTDGFTFTDDNVIEWTKDYPCVFPDAQSFIATDSDNIHFEKTKF